jgi:acetyl-CoA carboxylase alpha subunit
MALGRPLRDDRARLGGQLHPELAAAILKRPATEIRPTAEQLRLRPQDLAELGVIREDR